MFLFVESLKLTDKYTFQTFHSLSPNLFCSTKKREREIGSSRRWRSTMNISIQYDVGATRNPLSEPEVHVALTIKKQLRRLPHVFSRVLELPFRSDADVFVDELPHSFRFVVLDTPGGIAHVEAHTHDVHPGLSVTKIVVNETETLQSSLGDLDLDIWRFRLPESTRPELASAALVDGKLIVTVPKEEADDESVWRSENKRMDGSGTLVLV